jgi:hypothetical protein
MADIDIVPKHRSRSMMWVLLVIAVIALLAWMMMRQSPSPAGSVRAPAAAIASLDVATPTIHPAA